VSIVEGTFIPGIAMIAVSQIDPVLHKYLIVGIVTIGHAFNEGIHFYKIAFKSFKYHNVDCYSCLGWGIYFFLSGYGPRFRRNFTRNQFDDSIFSGICYAYCYWKTHTQRNHSNYYFSNIFPLFFSEFQGTQEEWSHVYIMFGGLYFTAGILWILTGTSELQSWGKMKETVQLELIHDETFHNNKDSE